MSDQRVIFQVFLASVATNDAFISMLLFPQADFLNLHLVLFCKNPSPHVSQIFLPLVFLSTHILECFDAVVRQQQWHLACNVLSFHNFVWISLLTWRNSNKYECTLHQELILHSLDRLEGSWQMLVHMQQQAGDGRSDVMAAIL